MVGKLGAGVLAAALGTGLFLAGSVAPAAVRESVEGFFSGVQQDLLRWTGRAATAAPAAGPADGAAPAAKPAPAALGAAAPSAGPAPTPAAPASSVPIASLLLPAVVPNGRSFALQAGQFASQLSAQQLATSLHGQGMTSTVILTHDDLGTNWAVVSLGNFPSAEEAAAQRTYLANKLGLSDYLPTLLLPPPPAPPAPAPGAAAPAAARPTL